MRTKEVWEDLEVKLEVKPEEHPFRRLDIKIYQGVTVGSGDADPMLLCFSGMEGCSLQAFRVLHSECHCQTLHLYNTNCYI